MTRSIVRVGFALALVVGIVSFVAAQKPGLKDVPLVVSFYNQLCSAGPAWCGDSLGEYESDAREKSRVVEITYFDRGENGGVGGGLPLTLVVADRAAQLSADHGLRTPDAIQLATALVAGATGFVTTDLSFRRIKEIEVLVLEDLVIL